MEAIESDSVKYNSIQQPFTPVWSVPAYIIVKGCKSGMNLSMIGNWRGVGW